MRYWIKSGAAAALFLLSGCGLAEESANAEAVDAMQGAAVAMLDDKAHQQIIDKLYSKLKLKVTAAADAPVAGLVQLVTEKGLFYASADGKYLMQARIFNLDEGMRDETDAALAGIRLDGIDSFSGSMIEFKAENEKYVISVFTDISCGYCRKLHNEIDTYLERGITVRYLAFPRGGANSKSFADMVSVWCSDDQQQAMTIAKAGEPIAKKSCNTEVAAQFAFGQRVGVKGTPNIVLPDGSLVPGYQPAEMLEKAIQDVM